MVNNSLTTGTIVAIIAVVVSVVSIVGPVGFLVAHLGPRIEALEKHELYKHKRMTERLFSLEEKVASFRSTLSDAEGEIKRIERKLVIRGTKAERQNMRDIQDWNLKNRGLGTVPSDFSLYLKG